MNWYLAHCKPRQEQRALVNLKRQGYRCYLPLAANPQRRRRAARRSEPLFSRYLFVGAGQDRSLAPVDATSGVARLVRFGEDLARVPGEVIDSLQAATDPATGLINLNPATLVPGQVVDVFQGPLAGLRGIFQAPSGEQRAWLLVEMLGQRRRLAVPLTALRAAR
ncbi:MAG: transcription termination/antitermination NusG family protein [Pseudomonadota bacterium]